MPIAEFIFPSVEFVTILPPSPYFPWSEIETVPITYFKLLRRTWSEIVHILNCCAYFKPDLKLELLRRTYFPGFL